MHQEILQPATGQRDEGNKTQGSLVQDRVGELRIPYPKSRMSYLMAEHGEEWTGQ
jgi:hypothetical protein